MQSLESPKAIWLSNLHNAPLWYYSKAQAFLSPHSVFSMSHAATAYRWPGRREGRHWDSGQQSEPASLTSVVTARSAWLHRMVLTTGSNVKRCSDGLNMLKQQAQPGGIIELDLRVTEQEPPKPQIHM